MYFYFYNIFLIAFYLITVTISSIGLISIKNSYYKKITISFILLTLLFIFDNFIISLTELFQFFAFSYNSEAMGAPPFKLFFYLISNLIFIFLFRTLSKKKDNYIFILISLIFFAISTFLSLQESSNLQVFLFYLPNQIFYILLGIWGVYHYRNSLDKNKLLLLLSFILIVFGILITLEDYFVIFYFDKYSAVDFRIQNRNFSSDFLFISVCLMSLRFTRHHFIQKYQFSSSPEEKSPSSESEKTSEKTTSKKAPSIDGFSKAYHLTSREEEIITLIIQGNSNQEIADKLFLSIGTVKAHVHNIFVKLDVSKRQQIIKQFKNFNEKFLNP